MRFYNNDRPHEGIGQRPPASVYQPSALPLPRKLPALQYPAHFEKRLVSKNGGIRWYRGGWVNVSYLLAGEYVGLEEIADGVCDVYFGPVWLGRLDRQEMTITDRNGKANTKRWKASR